MRDQETSMTSSHSSSMLDHDEIISLGDYSPNIKRESI